MNVEQLREEKRQVLQAKNAKYDLWIALSKTQDFYFEQRNWYMFNTIQASKDMLMQEYEALLKKSFALDCQINEMENAPKWINQHVQNAPKFPTGFMTRWGMHKARWSTLYTECDPSETIPNKRAPGLTAKAIEALHGKRSPGLHLSDVFGKPAPDFDEAARYLDNHVHLFNITYTLDGVNYRACANCGHEEVVKSWRAEIVDEAIKQESAR